MKEKIVLTAALFLCFSYTLIAQGDLLIFPKRIVFEGIQNRVKTINLANIGKDTATYKLSYNQIRMGIDGSFNPIKVPELDQKFASPNLRFYPRRITLAPNESQTVKIQLINTNKLKQGEYRSHLYFRGVPKVTLLKKEDLNMNAQKTKKMRINLVPVFGLSIANIITIGENTTKVQLTNLKVDLAEDKSTILSLDFNRQGNQSAYGNIEVNYISTEGLKQKVALIKGFAIYSPGKLRQSKIALDNRPQIDYSKGELQVSFTSLDTLILYAKANLTLN
jgi:hypothetical protein